MKHEVSVMNVVVKAIFKVVPPVAYFFSVPCFICPVLTDAVTQVKNLEAQLEEEEEERASIMKQKRELEQQLSELRNNQPLARRDADTEKR